MKKIIILILITILHSCDHKPKVIILPLTTVKVYYQDGTNEVLKVPAKSKDIYLHDYKGSSTLRYYNEEHSWGKDAASGVRRFEVIK